MDQRCYLIPHGLNLRFFGRPKELRILKQALYPKPGTRLRAIGIHGLGGVGKTQLALQHANTSLHVYHVIAWIPADTQANLVHALSSLARKLGLVVDDGAGSDDFQTVSRVRDWLNTTSKPFLLVQIWPASDQGSIIITTRSPSSFPAGTQREALRFLSGLDASDSKETAAAPMMQIANFIRERRSSYGEVEEILRESAQKLYTRVGPPAEYQHTRLSPEATALLNLLEVITNKEAGIHDTRLGFALDKFSFGEAVAELAQNSLIKRQTASKTLSTHFQILSSNFPSTWKEGGAHQGHGWASWAACGKVIPHVARLMDLFAEHEISLATTVAWAELLFRAGAYLWEKEQPSQAKSFVESGLGVGENLAAAVRAQARRLLGNIFMDLARPRAALAEYERALALREALDGPDSPAVANVCDSIACAYTELDDVDQAFEYLKRATRIHNALDRSNMSRTLAIRAMTCLRAGVPDDALAALRECWRLQGMTQEQIEASECPKHSGDILLLVRILLSQGKRDDAFALVERVPPMRAAAYGEDPGGPRLWDTFFFVARIHDENGEAERAVRTWKDLVDACDKTPELKPHLARALWFYANAAAKTGADRVAVEARKKGWGVRSAIEEREWPDEETDESYMRLVPWMLW
ncbi:P-loop containing nucleoside triphosphate hydrolase protein [Parachaetomium inaequale]|uniref:P-loop containing nucleoside triphosphate hydrolase protein n=1 Tax=Parachaetomium inaequale TaxID=2588326 RepID=A0AAN6PP00_9PEZI|nr:P-loop containing nucleoside triphosphate hydrolase protein [Parachaetomium inaequale]